MPWACNTITWCLLIISVDTKHIQLMETATNRRHEVGTRAVPTLPNILHAGYLTQFVPTTHAPTKGFVTHRSSPASSDNDVYEDIQGFPISPSIPEVDLPPTGSHVHCKMALCNDSINRFRHQVDREQLNFVYLNLIPGTNITLKGKDNVVAKNTWVWTFYGKDGALEFLSLPYEFKIWSAGLLYAYATGPLNMHLIYVSGDCSNVLVGQKGSNLAIGKALSKLTDTLMHMIYPEYRYRYGPSFWCYLERTFINPEGIYILCKHIVCPLPALEYRCCNYVYGAQSGNRTIKCERNPHRYDSLWWTMPIVIATILFAYCPLLIMLLSSKCSMTPNRIMTDNGDLYGHINGDDVVQDVVYLDKHYPVTFSGTLFSPFAHLMCSNVHCWSRTVRVFIPFTSLTIIAIQILLDYCFLYDFVMASIDKGVPIGFRSVLAGYQPSCTSFMPYLGGPFVAVPVYVCITCLFMATPKSLSELLQSGIGKSATKSLVTLVALDLKTIETFGAVTIGNQNGYLKIYSVYSAQFFMLMNIKFWKHAWSIQYERWNSLCVCSICWPLLPPYLVICLVELAFCLIIYGLPIVSFGITIIVAYGSAVSGCLTRYRTSWIRRLLQVVLNGLLICCVLFFLFMFGSIFLDACLFLTRMCMFTYTGIIVYPKVSYGILIFVFTAIYYMAVCAKSFAEKYRRLLKTSITVCEKIQRGNDQPRLVVDGKNGFRGINRQLFEHIIEVHCPKRKQVFISVLKLTIIVAILGISLSLLTKTDRFRELHTLMHVGTALFTCALPSICIKACRGPDDKLTEKLFKKEVSKTVRNHAGYLQNDDTSESD